MQNRELWLILVVIIAVQTTGFFVIAKRLPGTNVDTTNATLARLLAEVEALKSRESRNITTTGGLEINISKQDIERAVSDAVQAVMEKQPLNGKASHSSDYYQEEPVLSVDAEQTRMTSEREAYTVMDNAVTAGHWTQQDTDALLPHLGNLSQAQRNKLIKEFLEAVNNNSIQLDAPPPPF